MYRPNTGHKQTNLFGVESWLPKAKLKRLMASQEVAFYHLIFCRIDEDLFSILYSDKKSRPNAPVNAMVSALILMQQKGLTYKQLFEDIDFNLKTRAALGLQDYEETPFSPSTLFDFQNKVNAYWLETGVNLFEVVFDSLTRKQLEELKIKTGIQRSDSFLAASNIRRYSRVQLLVEVLIRFYRMLSEEDRAASADLLHAYVHKTSGNYIYGLKRDDLPHELTRLGRIYHTLYHRFRDTYGDQDAFNLLARVYQEHFLVTNDRVRVRKAAELSGASLQSPDDGEATYRKKGDRESRGQTIHITETAHPENQVNLLTDVAVAPNTRDDAAILADRLDNLKDKTPELNELHTDGGYGSETNDIKMEAQGIDHIQTAVKGHQADFPLQIERLDSDSPASEYTVSCPYQQVRSQPTRKRSKALFKAGICQQCACKNACPTILQIRQPGRVYYFTHADYLLHKRHRSLKRIPPERWKLRPNVEATVKEFRFTRRNVV